jgi:hypothetical protein
MLRVPMATEVDSCQVEPGLRAQSVRRSLAYKSRVPFNCHYDRHSSQDDTAHVDTFRCPVTCSAVPERLKPTDQDGVIVCAVTCPCFAS